LQGVQHGGSVDGVSTALALFPDDGLGLITLCNGDAQYGANQEVMWTIADEVFGIESAARPPPVFVFPRSPAAWSDGLEQAGACAQ
jgi:hypothetical protein